MLTTFTLLAIASGVFRLGLYWFLLRRFNLALGVPSALAGGLVVLAALPDLLKPFPFPLPLSVTLGLLLPDLVLRRA